MKLHWLNYWMLLHAGLFWVIIYFCIFKILDYSQVEWGTLFQWWWWNLFAYLYVAFAHIMVVYKKKLSHATEKNESLFLHE